MAGEQHSDLDYADKLWQAADKLRGQVDAAEYKHVVLGLLFLKYISDAFESRRDQLEKELKKDGIKGKQLADLLENRDEYTAERVFWVPPEARWSELQGKAVDPKIAQHIDDAILAVEASNEKLKGKLPRDYARRGINPTKLGELITDVIAQIGFKGSARQARDTLGRVYEYFLGKFAAAEGKLGGEFYTPRCVVRLLVEMLEPYEGRIYDPACGSGGMFTQAERFVEAHGGNRKNVSIFGQESNPTTWRLAHMNLAIHSIEANLSNRPADTFLQPQHPDLKADFVLANPPFNVSDWGGKLLENDVRWQFGTPPAGNANYAWIQHFIHHLAPPNGTGGGMAGFVMANGSLSSTSGGEGEIRRKIVEADLVDCIVALPPQLFFTTPIPVCLWFLARDKTRNPRKRDRDTNPWRNRSGEVLFIDARKFGTMQTRTLRALSGTEPGEMVDKTSDPRPDTDIGRIVTTYRQWRGEKAPAWWDATQHGEWIFKPTAGFCTLAKLDTIAEQNFDLSPGIYVGTTGSSVRLGIEARQRTVEKIDKMRELSEAASKSADNGLFDDLGRIPLRVVTVADVASTARRVINPSAMPDERFALYSLPAYDAEEMPEIVRGKQIMSGKIRMTAPCILFSKLNPHTPRIWLIEDTPPPNAVCSPEFIVLIPKVPKDLIPLYCALRSADFTSDICAHAKGSTGSRQRVSAANVLAAAVRLPAASDLDRFLEHIAPIVRLARLAKRTSRSITELHDAAFRIFADQLASEV